MLSCFWPIVIILISMASVQGSSSLAKYLFPILGPSGMTAWRLFFSSIMLVLIFKPWRKPISKQAWKYIVILAKILDSVHLYDFVILVILFFIFLRRYPTIG